LSGKHHASPVNFTLTTWAIEPEVAGAHMSFNLLVLIVVGGTRTIAGTIIGPLLWFVLVSRAAQALLFFGLIIVVII
jgi:ABC-type branched-subunit amino acid transport system permease subunit